MPRQRKQHKDQRPSRRRTYRQGAGTGEKYKPGFPMNLFQANRLFWAIGGVAMVGGLIAAFFVGNAANPADDPLDLPTATPVPVETGTPGETPEGTPTPTKSFSAAEQVLVPTSDYTATISTSKGDIELELFADIAPNTVNSFVFLAQQGFYDGIVFHRVEPGFVVQAGDPDGVPGNGNDGPGYVTQDEPNEVRNERGTLSMAKVSGQTQFGSQFFINLDDNAFLDFDSTRQDHFYPFARVTAGMDIVDQIAQGDVIETITIVEHPDPNAPTPTPTVEAEGTGTPSGDDDTESDEDLEAPTEEG